MESANKMTTPNTLKIVSVNVTDKFKKKPVDTDEKKHKDDCQIISKEQKDGDLIIPSVDRNADMGSEQSTTDIK